MTEYVDKIYTTKAVDKPEVSFTQENKQICLAIDDCQSEEADHCSSFPYLFVFTYDHCTTVISSTELSFKEMSRLIKLELHVCDMVILWSSWLSYL